MPHRNLLLVEGKSEQFAIPYFMDHFVVWGDNRENWVVEIIEKDGLANLLTPGEIETYLKRSGLKALGVIIDADQDFQSRWSSVRDRFGIVDPKFPDDLPKKGLIHVDARGLRLGVWIMPDNQSIGMFETFLKPARSASRSPLWDLALNSCEEIAAAEGAYKSVHKDKAHLHTFLAWIDPPGKSPQEAVRDKVLDANTPLGRSFADWMIKLFELSRRPNAPDSPR